jgi:hypothetical protein
MRSSDKKTFILQQPTSTPAAEVVRAARRAGLSLSEGYVYVIRSAGARGRTPARGPRGARRTRATDTAPVSAFEQRFLASALEVGIGRASEILQTLQRRFDDLD